MITKDTKDHTAAQTDKATELKDGELDAVVGGVKMADPDNPKMKMVEPENSRFLGGDNIDHNKLEETKEEFGTNPAQSESHV